MFIKISMHFISYDGGHYLHCGDLIPTVIIINYYY